MRCGAQAIGTPRAGRHRHLDVAGWAMDARTHAVVDHRFEERQSAHDQPGRRGACGGERRVLRLPRDPRASACKRLSLLHRQRQRNCAAPLSGARHAGRDAAARRVRGDHCRRTPTGDVCDPRPLRGQTALLRGGERRRVLRVGDQGAVGAGCAGRMGPRGRYRRVGKISRENRVRRNQYCAAGLLCDRQRWRCSHLSVLGLGDPDC